MTLYCWWGWRDNVDNEKAGQCILNWAHTNDTFYVASVYIAVYFTTLDPKTDPGELIKNNWGPQKQDNEENQKKIAWFVKIGMPTDVVIDRRSESDRRDIYTYSEEYENVKLSEYNHEICKNTNPGLIALPESEQNEKICLSSAHAHSLAAMLSPLILVVSFFQVI